MKIKSVNINGQDYDFDVVVEVKVKVLPMSAPFDFASKLAWEAINNDLDIKAREMAESIKERIENHWSNLK